MPVCLLAPCTVINLVRLLTRITGAISMLFLLVWLAGLGWCLLSCCLQQAHNNLFLLLNLC